MKTNPIKKKLKSGQPTFGTWLSLGDLYAARVMARLGWDWLTLDMEHQPIDWSQAAAIFGAIADAGCVPLARVPEGNHFLIKRALDSGAWGIVAPMINTVEQARDVIAATKYPPVGNRSLGGGLHALNFDGTTAEYYRQANDEILVVLQTESPLGVAHAEAIYSLPGVDAIFVGPVDLHANLRQADGTEASDVEFETTLDKIIAAGKKTGTPTGMHVMSVEIAQKRAAQGMQFLAVASELRMMTAKAEEFLKALKSAADKSNIAGY
ncbi:MAG TPA: aldolase/citrate lyase family protein [Pirellulales bacterium]|jgi:4-hydroxy-2-oxoheptanedioate aldolase|nr:aldolase/citrate lyase family protein [Pirellulales bacterium]